MSTDALFCELSGGCDPTMMGAEAILALLARAESYVDLEPKDLFFKFISYQKTYRNTGKLIDAKEESTQDS